MTPSRWWDHRGPVHHVVFDGPDDAAPFVLVHGLGGHHRNWMRLAPLLAPHGRVFCLDYRGFGYTPLGEHRSTLEHNRELLAAFLREVVRAPAIVVGNSTGGVLCTRLTAREPHLVRGMILVDPALPGAARGIDLPVAAGFAALLVPQLGERVTANRARRRGLEGVARETIALCTVRPDLVPPEMIEAHLAMARERQEMAWAQPAFLQLARSLLPALMRSRAYHRVTMDVARPTLLLHGTQDRLVPVARARALHRLRPDWTYAEFAHLGHAPMFEDPDTMMDAIAPWLDGLGAGEPSGRAQPQGELF